MTDRMGVVLDAGAFIALERRDARAVRLVHRFATANTPLVTSAGVVAEIWRGGAGAQIPIVFLLRRTNVVDLTYAVARTLGRMMAVGRTRDPVDAHVVLLARERDWPVLTCDPDDLRALDPSLRIEVI